MNSVTGVSYVNTKVPFASAQNQKLQGVPITVTPGTDSPKVSTSKKWGVGLASMALPGIGQGINGEWGKAALIGIPAIICRGISQRAKNSIIAPLTFFALAILSACDAVKHAKPDAERIIIKG